MIADVARADAGPHFRLTEDLVVQAAVLDASRYSRRLLWFAAFTGVLVSGFFLFVRQEWSFDRALIQIALTVSGSVAVALVLNGLLRFWINPFQARRNFRQQRALSDEMSLSWTETEFCLAAGRSQTAMPFGNLHGYRTSDEMIILYVSDVLYHAFPRQAFSGIEQRRAFMRRLEESGVRRR